MVVEGAGVEREGRGEWEGDEVGRVGAWEGGVGGRGR